MNKIKPRKKVLQRGLIKNQKFLLERFSQEWGGIQKEEEKRKKIAKLKGGAYKAGKILLSILAVGGVLTIALVAPGMFAAFDKHGRRMFISKNDFKKIRWDGKRQERFICVENNDGSYTVRMTQKGKICTLENLYHNMQLSREKGWDGLWRFVLFDIPNKHKAEREDFRKKLRELGFHQLQESVLVSPYFCDNEMHFLTSLFGIGSYVYFFKVSDRRLDKELIGQFDIS